MGGVLEGATTDNKSLQRKHRHAKHVGNEQPGTLPISQAPTCFTCRYLP